MRERAGLLMMAVLLAACGSGGAATGQPKGAAGRTARAPDVAGVRVGDAAAQARAILERAGWKVAVERGEAWDAAVDHEIKHQRGVFPIAEPKEGVASLTASKGSEEVFVQARPTPNGDVVRMVRYTAPMAGRSYEDVGRQLTTRYGSASRNSTGGLRLNMVWCSGGENCRDASGSAKPAMEVREQPPGTLMIIAYEGSEAEELGRSTLQRAVSERMGAKSSF